jgi:two-component system chemotaxis response regulator CheY
LVKRVVIADDSAAARQIIQRCLEISGLAGATFYEAEDGEAALRLVEAHQIDLITTGLNMPKMDGNTLLKRLKSSARYQELPVLVVSSASNATVERGLMQAGAFAVVDKPITPASMAMALATVTGLRCENEWGQ